MMTATGLTHPNFSDNFLIGVALGVYKRYALEFISGDTHTIALGARTFIWSGKGILNEPLYTFLTLDQGELIDSVSSSSAADTGIVLLIRGLHIDGLERIQKVILNGQNRVPLPYPIYRHNMSYTITKDMITGDPNRAAGTIFIYCNSLSGGLTAGVPNTASSVKGIIVSDFEKTEQAIYTVPSNATGFLLHIIAGASKKQAVTVEMTLNAKLPYESRKLQGHITATSDKDYNPTPAIPRAIPPFTDVWVTTEDASADVGIFASAALLLYYANDDHKKLVGNLDVFGNPY